MKKHFELFLHAFVWFCIFHWLDGRVGKHALFPDGIKNIGYYVNTNFYLWLWHITITVFKAGFFYINVYWLFPKYSHPNQHTHYLKPLAVNTATCMLAEFILVFGVYKILVFYQNGEEYLQWDYNFLNAQLIPYTFYLLLSYGYWAARQWWLNQHTLQQLDKTTAELALLKTQINPHFLFNTLNNLFSMAIEKQAHELAESIAQLTGMMRYTIYESNGAYVPLAKEVEYIENYIQLQRLRFTEEEVPVHFTTKGDLRHVQVSPMLLINFVENAFKHGISLKKESFIDIAIAVRENQIHFTVVNTIHRQNAQASVKHAGFGLENTQKLLNLQYPDRHTLEIKEENNLFKVTLMIQLQKQKIEVIA